MIILFASPCLIISNRASFCVTANRKELFFSFFIIAVRHINSDVPINQKCLEHGQSSVTGPLYSPTLSPNTQARVLLGSIWGILLASILHLLVIPEHILITALALLFFLNR